jgi:hypothetical protein
MPVTKKHPSGRSFYVRSDCCHSDTTLQLEFLPVRWSLVCLRCDRLCGEDPIQSLVRR